MYFGCPRCSGAVLMLTVALLALGTLAAPPYALRLQQQQPLQHILYRQNNPALVYRVYAIGDIHGDFSRTRRILTKAGVIDAEDPAKWTAGNATLVQTGDVIDRGNDTISLLTWLHRLGLSAQSQGGRVVRLLGNHEYMNVLGDWRYVSDGDVASFPEPHEKSRRESFEREGVFGKLFLQEYYFSYRHGGVRAHFQHAGLHPDWAREELNNLGREFLSFCFEAAENNTSVSQSPWRDFYSSEGPLWNRQYYNLPENELCPLAKRTMCALGVDVLVFGHTPNLQGVVSRCDGSVILIDTGLTSVYGGRPAVLELRKYAGSHQLDKLVHYLDTPTVQAVRPLH